ncbi:MAG: flavodoxin family protein [Anaerolineae bacterium]
MTETPTLICLLGSPRRRGNSDTLAAEVCRGFNEAGGTSRQIALSSLDLQPCNACDWCKTDHPDPEPCVIQDDMQRVYDEMLAASAILWATPIYSWAPTVEMKTVLDRQFAWGEYQSTHHARALAGRPVGLAVTYADPDPVSNGFYHCYHILRIVATASGGRVAGCVHGAAGDPGGIVHQPDVIEAARALGHKLFHLSPARSE